MSNKERCPKCQRVMEPIFSTGIAMKRDIHCTICGYKWTNGRTSKARKRWEKELSK